MVTYNRYVSVGIIKERQSLDFQPACNCINKTGTPTPTGIGKDKMQGVRNIYFRVG